MVQIECHLMSSPSGNLIATYILYCTFVTTDCIETFGVISK